MKRNFVKNRLKSCPFCGKTRKNGYFRACKECYWVLDTQKQVIAIVDQLKQQAKAHEITIRCSFIECNALFACQTSAFCDIKDVTSVGGELRANLKERFFSVNQMVSFRDLETDTANRTVMVITEMLRKLRKGINEKIDANGKGYEIAGVPIPAVGNWGSWKNHRRR